MSRGLIVIAVMLAQLWASGCTPAPITDSPSADEVERSVVIDMPVRSDDAVGEATADEIPAVPVGQVVSVRPMLCGAVTLRADVTQPTCEDDAIISGSGGAEETSEAIGAIVFQVPRLPPGVQLIDAEVTLTGKDASEAANVGRWYVRVVRLGPEVGLPEFTFGRLMNAPADVPGLAWRLRSDEIAAGAVRRLEIERTLLPVLETTLNELGGRLVLRIDGPTVGTNRFAWHARGEHAPRLRIAWAVEDGSIAAEALSESLIEWEAP